MFADGLSSITMLVFPPVLRVREQDTTLSSRSLNPIIVLWERFPSAISAIFQGDQVTLMVCGSEMAVGNRH